MSNFWKDLNKNFLALAPMAGITDSAFRQICKDYGADVLYSEMASATALLYSSDKTLEMLQFKSKERPYVVQLFGSDYKHFAQATKTISEEIKPDGIDINFGCPVKKVVKQGAGAVLMTDLSKAYSVIKATIENTDLPISIKVRTQAGDVHLFDFLKKINDLDVRALMIHGRSLAQGFGGNADWAIGVKARDYFGGKIIINGGIKNLQDASRAINESQADGLGLAQGALGRPWLFQEIKKGLELNLSRKNIFKIAIEHSELAKKEKDKQGIIEMRKHLCWYVQGLPGAKKLRQDLIRVESAEDVKNILKL